MMTGNGLHNSIALEAVEMLQCFAAIGTRALCTHARNMVACHAEAPRDNSSPPPSTFAPKHRSKPPCLHKCCCLLTSALSNNNTSQEHWI